MSTVFYIFWMLILIAQLSLVLWYVFEVFRFERKYPSKKKEKTHPESVVSIGPIDDLFSQSKVGRMSIEEYNLHRRVLIDSLIGSNKELK